MPERDHEQVPLTERIVVLAGKPGIVFATISSEGIAELTRHGWLHEPDPGISKAEIQIHCPGDRERKSYAESTLSNGL